MHRALFHRRGSQVVVRFVRTLGHIFYALLDDPETLPHLLNAHRGARIAIARAGCGNVERKLLVAAVGLLLAEIPFQAAGAQIRAGYAPLDGLVCSECADSLSAPFEDRVPHHRAVILDQARWKVTDEIEEHFLPALG